MSEPIQSIAQNNYILQMPPASSYMNLSGLEYDGDKISGYAGSAFKAGDTLPESVSAATDYVTATSGDINSTIDNVSSNSGVWGGSALPISAGPCINLALSGDMLYIDVDSDYIVVTEETVGSYTVNTNDVQVAGTFSKASYRPIAWTWKYGYAASLNFNQENTVINADNSLYFQGYVKRVVGSGDMSITFKLFITWVRV